MPDGVRWSNRCLIRVSERELEEDGAEAMFEEILVSQGPQHMKDASVQIEKAQ